MQKVIMYLARGLRMGLHLLHKMWSFVRQRPWMLLEMIFIWQVMNIIWICPTIVNIILPICGKTVQR